jgi:hypothetical protein
MTVATASSACQVCFDDVKAPELISKLCSSKCPAQICTSCLKRHLEVALEVPYTGALPRVKCPICLIPINREQWSRRLTVDDPDRANLRLEYRRLCLTSCRFGVPCCHKGSYIHMPAFYTTKLTNQYARHAVPVTNADALVMPDKQKKQQFLRGLRRVGERFCRHDPEMAAGDVVRFLEDNFPYDSNHDVYSLTNPMQIAYQLLATRILDEERRARLVLAFHRRYPHMLTRCCGSLMCFNCKRGISLPEPPSKVMCVCEREEANTDETTPPSDITDDSCMVECRSCRVMLVKVDGCDSVVCPCGNSMRWNYELEVLDWVRRKLVPVDVFDVTVFSLWETRKYRLKLLFGGSAFRNTRISLYLRVIARQEAGSGRGFIETMRRHVLRRQFAFRLRKEWIPAIRMKLAIRRCPTFTKHLVRLVWRRRFDKVVEDIRDGYKARVERLRELRQRSFLQKLCLSVMTT